MFARLPRRLMVALACGIVSLSASCGGSLDTPGATGGDGSGGADGSSGRDGSSGADGSGGTDGNGNDGSGGADGSAGADGDPGVDCPSPGETDIRFPMPVDDYFFVSGYSGDGEQGKVREGTCPRRAGDGRGACHAFTYEPGSNGWASVTWQYPPDNWGAAPGRTIPRGAREISFYAWSDAGGEKVKFGAGINGVDNFAVEGSEITLTGEPTRYTVSLSGQAYYCADVVGGFFWAAAATSATKFYVDDIAWEGENPDEGGDDLPPLDPNWPAGPGAQGVSLRVRNFCSFPLFIGGSGQEASLERVRLARGEYHDYDVPKVWTAARVNAFGSELDSDPRDKAELTFYHNGGDGQFHVSYNVTYVDWLGLPMEITALGGSCNPNDHTTGCSVPEHEVRDGCPQPFLASANRCLSPRTYCLGPRSGEDYCHKFDEVIASCAQCPKGSTAEAYACSGPYAEEPRLCAAVNRGMTSDPDNPNESAYYQNPPYNDYAKWVHQVCPGIYAFSYDDQFSHGGYRDCASGNEVRITFCPGG